MFFDGSKPDKYYVSVGALSGNPKLPKLIMSLLDQWPHGLRLMIILKNIKLSHRRLKMNNISFIGMAGCGKSTLGKAFSEKA